MTSVRKALLLLSYVGYGLTGYALTGCGLVGSGTATLANASPAAQSGSDTGVAGSPANNVMQVTVDGSLCSAATTAEEDYVNKPCASITICQPGTSNCQTVSDILIDTGSYGLRLFSSGTNANGSSYDLASLSLPSVTQSGEDVADCAQFLDGSALWGPVVRADVILASGGETAAVPIQLIDSSYGGSTPKDCDDGSAASDAEDAGFNGILGVGLWAQDCGPSCDPAYESSVGATGISASYYPYYTCSGSSCTQALVSMPNQVTNPVSAFPVNNNGLIFELPGISASGVTSVNGSVVFGIGTESNNALPGSAHVYSADDYADFATSFNSVTYSDSGSDDSVVGSFIDSGSNTFYFTPPTGVDCCEENSDGDVLDTLVSCSASDSSGWICSSYSGSATNYGTSFSTGATSGSGVSVSFSVADFFTLTDNSSAMVFSNIADADEQCSSESPCTFDWGLPFFFGRNVYVGFQKLSGDTLVTQPYWAY